MIHWLQIIGTDSLTQFDYGEELNLKYYNSTTPPHYDIEKLKHFKIDMFITTSSADPYCLKEDFHLTMATFRNAKVYTKDVGNYNHLDYLWSHNAHRDIYTDLVNFLEDI